MHFIYDIYYSCKKETVHLILGMASSIHRMYIWNVFKIEFPLWTKIWSYKTGCGWADWLFSLRIWRCEPQITDSQVKQPLHLNSCKVRLESSAPKRNLRESTILEQTIIFCLIVSATRTFPCLSCYIEPIHHLSFLAYFFIKAQLSSSSSMYTCSQLTFSFNYYNYIIQINISVRYLHISD